jgi:hypothetical protein
MTGYSFNRVRTAALKSLAAMQDRLENIAADFGDVDMFLVGEADKCRERLQEFAERLAIAADPAAGERVMRGYTLKKLRTHKLFPQRLAFSRPAQPTPLPCISAPTPSPRPLENS